jgi:hypothetical protein
MRIDASQNVINAVMDKHKIIKHLQDINSQSVISLPPI